MAIDSNAPFLQGPGIDVESGNSDNNGGDSNEEDDDSQTKSDQDDSGDESGDGDDDSDDPKPKNTQKGTKVSKRSWNFVRRLVGEVLSKLISYKVLCFIGLFWKNQLSVPSKIF